MELDESIADIAVYGDVKLSKLMSYRVVVVTLCSAGRLVSKGVPEGHFTHVFIDEAGQAAEPETLIPIAGLLSAKGNDHAINTRVNCSTLAWELFRPTRSRWRPQSPRPRQRLPHRQGQRCCKTNCQMGDFRPSLLGRILHVL